MGDMGEDEDVEPGYAGAGAGYVDSMLRACLCVSARQRDVVA